MKFLTPVACICLLLFVASCGSDPRTQSERMMARSSASATDSSGTADVYAESPAPASGDDKVLSLNAPARKIIKTADLRCRVEDVYTATTRIERMANAIGGQIANSKLENVTEESRTLPYKTDSLQQVESFTTTAQLTLRIPVNALDTILADIAGDAAFINNRSLHLDDATLRYLSNKLKQEAMAAHDATGRSGALAKRTGDAIVSGIYTDDHNEASIDRRIGNMQLVDQAAYATLTVELYQPPRISRSIMPDMEALMKPTMGQQAALALNNGWQLLRGLLIALLTVWPLLLVSAAGYFAWHVYRLRSVRQRS